jgi:hypothetical protein
MRWSLPLACLLTLSAHAGPAADAGTPAAAKAVPGQPTTAPVSGVILANFDRSVRPQDDFYRFVNGVLRNMAQFDASYDVRPGDKLYLPPDQRVAIW